MRILHLVGSISPAAGGPTEVIRMLVKYAPPGYESEVATTDPPAAPFLSDFPCPVHAFGSSRERWYVPALRRWLEQNRHRFDGAIVHGLWAYTGVAAREALAGHLPYIVFPHGMLDPYFRRAHPFKHAKKLLYWLFLEYWTLRRADFVCFTTQVERALARKTFFPTHWNAMVTAIGCEPPPPPSSAQASAFAAVCPGLAGRRFLLFLGRIDPKKGCDLLLDAFAGPHGVAAQDPELHLLMAGPDATGWGASLRAGIADSPFASRVHWPGMLRGDAKYGALYACDAFVLPSHQENFGVAVAEALAAGKPALITRPINIAQDVASLGGGIMEDDTFDGVRTLLQRWISLPAAQRIRMGVRAREIFEERFNMRRNAQDILHIFERTAAETAAAPAGDPR